MSNIIDTDLCVIGAGSGGLSVAAGAAQLGRKVVLVEKGEMGGDCLNTGCVPSKALIAASARAHAMRNADKYGVRSVEPEIDFASVMDHVKRAIAIIEPNDSQERFEGLGVTVLRDTARFTGPREVKAGNTVIHAKYFIIAAGSSPLIPPIPGLSGVSYFTNETVFENNICPEHLIVIGGGPIGVEMAQAHRRLGAAVTLIEGSTILNKDDPELVAVVRSQLHQDGINLIENALVEKIEHDGTKISVIAGGQAVTGSNLLVAVGRRANVDGLGLEAANVDFTPRGITVDAKLRSSNSRIYAIGDIIGGRQFTHVAGYHASIIIRNILFKAPSKNNDAIAPWVTYSDPELAHVGLTENEARKQHQKIKVVKWPFAENDRAIAEVDMRGFVKVVTNNGGVILGASIVGHNAGDLIQSWALAIANKQKIGAFTAYIAPYPTRGEASKRAAGQWYTPTLFSKRTKMLVSLLSIFD